MFVFVFRSVCLVFVLFASIAIFAQPKASIIVKVDTQVELATIVARLAEFGEFKNDNIGRYAADVDRHFSSYKDHEVVRLARKLRETNGLAFSQYLSLAVHLNPDFSPKVAFTATVPHKDYGAKEAAEFARLLKKFWNDADCERFFKEHSDLFRETERRYQTVVNEVDTAWFTKFYGERPNGTFHIFISLLSGYGNFGEKVVFPRGRTDLFAIMGASEAGPDGIPVFSAKAELPVVIHEFNHSFINHLVDENPAPFQAACEKIFREVAQKMARQAYGGWQAPLSESLVRAGVARYLYEHRGIEAGNSQIVEEKINGFAWMDELFVLFGTYANNRRQFPTFRSFMPVLAGYHTDLANRVRDKIDSFEAMRPTVSAIRQFANGAEDVDPAITEITFVFDRPLVGKGVSISVGSLGRSGFPEIEKTVGFYNANATEYTLRVKLKPGTPYEFVLTRAAFKTKAGYPISEYVVKFKTK